jgi:ribosomal protein L12E/L44/L45/RPP1/RPP2
MQLKQLLPIFEITDNMSDASIFSVIEYIGQEIHNNHLQKIIDETLHVQMFEERIKQYATKVEALELDEKIRRNADEILK